MASVCASAVSGVLSGSLSRREAHASGAQELKTNFLGSSLRRHQLNATPMVHSRSGRLASPVAMATKKAPKDSKDPNSVRNAVLGLAGAAVLGFFGYLLTPDDIGMSAAVTLTPTTGNEVTGTVVFTELTSHFGAQYVKVDVDLAGLTPGRHGFHVHDKGNVTCGDGLCTGGHFNPEGKPHAGPKSSVRHVGDLGNVVAEADGTVKFSFLDSVIKLEGEKSIVGRSVVVHAAPDDLTSQPTGNAGGRVAYGTISLV